MTNTNLSNLFLPYLNSDQQLPLHEISELGDFCQYLNSENWTINNTVLTSSEDSLTITGNLAIFQSNQPIPIILLVQQDGANLKLKLTGNFDDGWKLSEGFGTLPRSFRKSPNFAGATYYGDSLFNDLVITNQSFIVANYIDKENKIIEGINFYGQLKVSQGLEPLQKLLNVEATLSLYGSVEIREEQSPIIKLFADIPSDKYLKFLHFNLHNLYLNLFTEYPEDDDFGLAESKVLLGSNVTTDGENPIEFTLIAIMSELDDAWSFSFEAVDNSVSLGRGFSALSSVAGFDLDIALPDTINKILESIYLKFISIQLNPFKPSINNLLFEVGLGETWKLIEGVVEIAEPAVGIYILLPFNPKYQIVHPYLTGTFVLGKNNPVHLDVEADYLDDFSVTANLREGDIISVSDVVESFTSLSNLPTIDIDELYLNADSSGYFLLEGSLQQNWEIPLQGNNNLVIENTWLRLERLDKDFTGSFSGYFEIAGVEIVLFAEQSSDEGWDFEGSTGEGQEIPIGQLIEDIANLFGDVTLPSSIEELIIQNLGISFNTKTKDFNFTCQSKFPVDEQEVDITVTIAITRQEDNSFNKEFTGYIVVGDLQFNLIFSKDNTTKTFIAAYNNPNGDSLVIKNLVADVSNNIATYIPESLQITLQNALFAYSKNQEKTSFLFGLNLGSQINLSNLPLVGKQFPPEQTISVDDLQFIIASQNLNLEEAETFNNLIPENISKLPLQTSEKPTETTPAIKKGFNLSANLQFGETTEILALPISSETEPDTTLEESPTPISDNSNTPPPDEATWFSLQKTFGPVYFERIGIQYQDAAIWFLLDANLSFTGLTLSLDGLAVGSPLKPFSPQFRLQGLGIDYRSGSNLTIAGAFLKLGNEYAGSVIISTSELTLSAIGSYSQTSEGHPSLFIYGILDYPLGGPSFFFVTGLALGFAYNRSLILPTLDQVPQYPLVQAALSGATKGTTGLIEMQRNLLPYIPPQVGQIAFAVGIKFTSFKIIESFALLVVSLGDRLEISVIGLSTIIAPSAETNPGIPPLAEVRIALLARFIPSEGILQVEGKVMPDSYLFARDCQLSGGFAFYCWFAGQYQGDFVLTVGGYHPDYQVPAHYPKVDRLGLNWRISDKLSIKGGIYFAITASAFMAGGRLEAVWQSGRLKAWFIAEAHFLISWKPYFYDIRLSVKIGVSYTFKIFGFRKRISVDVSASLHIWGPEFSGTAKIDISVISFTVKFGNRMSRVRPPISWSEFKTSFLPASEEVCTIRVKQGILKAIEKDSSELWIINPKEFTLIVGSVIPIKTADSVDFIDNTRQQEPVGIAPMAANDNQFSQSDCQITITYNQSNIEQEFSYVPVRKNVPIALWGEEQQTDLNGEKFVHNVLSGFEVKPKNPPKPGETQEIPKGNLSYDTENLTNFYEWRSFTEFSLNSETNEDQRSQAIAENMLTQDSTRRQLLSELGFSEEEINTIDLQALTNDVEQAFVVSPQLLEV
ncbi:MAG: hypothetical protein QNJ64_13300 [Crocosphaera sp.]|nr:hypothetical protein [Crocosphaera sp.]